MSISVHVPTQLRSLTGGLPGVEVSGSTVGEALTDLATRHPGIAQRIFGDEGRLRRFINVYVDDEDVRFLDGLRTTIEPDNKLVIIPAVAGGMWVTRVRSGMIRCPTRPSPQRHVSS